MRIFFVGKKIVNNCLLCLDGKKRRWYTLPMIFEKVWIFTGNDV